MANRIIVIEGTDASGKTTQVELLKKVLQEHNVPVNQMKYPFYDTPTGKIVGASYLGNPKYGEGLFPEGAINVDARVAAMYFAADRLYNAHKVDDYLKTSNLILDRYVESNMAHQGGKVTDKKKRFKMYAFLKKLEYDLLKLKKPDIKILLFMPREFAHLLKTNRNEALDQHEVSEDYLLLAQKAYLEVAKMQKYKIINCVRDGKIRSIEDINNELTSFVLKKLKVKPKR